MKISARTAQTTTAHMAAKLPGAEKCNGVYSLVFSIKKNA